MYVLFRSAEIIWVKLEDVIWMPRRKKIVLFITAYKGHIQKLKFSAMQNYTKEFKEYTAISLINSFIFLLNIDQIINLKIHTDRDWLQVSFM